MNQQSVTRVDEDGHETHQLPRCRMRWKEEGNEIESYFARAVMESNQRWKRNDGQEGHYRQKVLALGDERQLLPNMVVL